MTHFSPGVVSEEKPGQSVGPNRPRTTAEMANGVPTRSSYSGSSDSANSLAETKRRAGSTSNARAISPSSTAGASGRKTRTGTYCELRIEAKTASGVLPWKGRCRVSNSYR